MSLRERLASGEVETVSGGWTGRGERRWAHSARRDRAQHPLPAHRGARQRARRHQRVRCGAAGEDRAQAVRAARPGERAAVGGGSARDHHRTCSTTSSATGRSSRCSTTRRSPRSWSTTRRRSTSSAPARSTAPTGASSTRRTCCASSTRSSSQVGRRIDEASPMVDARLPDGSRVNADHRAAGDQRPGAHHPQVLQGPLHRPRPHRLRDAEREPRRVPRRLRRAGG